MEPSEPNASTSAAGKMILRWGSTASEDARDNMVLTEGRHEVDRYLDAVDELQTSMSYTSLSDSFSTSSSAIQIAMARLEDEFRNILLPHTSPIEADSFTESIHFESDSLEFEENAEISFDNQFQHQVSNASTTSSIREVDLIPSDAVYALRFIAEQMIAAGYLRECIQVYASVRKSAVNASLNKLNVEKSTIGDIQRLEWETLATKIRQWIGAAKICIRVIFASEKKLCDDIFEGLESSAGDACFMETIKGPAIQLFNFAEAISISRRSPEKLFKILDLHDALSDLLPDIATVFESKSSESIRIEAVEILSRLAEAARGILSEFENAVLHEPSKIPVPGGTVHPLTRYVMNYIGLFSDYKHTLIELIVWEPSTGSRYPTDPNIPDIDLSEFEGQASTLSLHLIWIIVILKFNLETKSNHYKDASLAHLFMMNNVHYIFLKIKGSPELREMIGYDFLKRLKGEFRSSSTNYQRSTWVRVLHCLRDEGLHVRGSSSASVSKSALRERFKAFNAMFEEVHRTQSQWLIPNTQLREELRISISEKVISAYRSFLGRFRSHIESGRHPENYIKYSVEDLDNAILDLFEGYSVPQHLRRRSE